MDSSGLIFVALAIAWAVYLIPKAMRYTDAEKRSRPVDRFSDRMRVLARSGADSTSGTASTSPAAGRTAARPAAQAQVQRPELSPAQLRARRAAHRKATKRRRNVLSVILVSLIAVAVMAGMSLFTWWYVAIPGAVLVGWLTLCRVMVKGERAGMRPQPVVAPSDLDDVEDELVHPDEFAVAVNAQGFDEVSDKAITSVLADASAESRQGLWDPVPMTLPTYVDKAPAKKRTVAQIDLDSTGVWSSGRSEVDSALAREADAAAKEKDRESVRRAAGE